MSGHARPLALIEDAPGFEERVISLRGEIDVGSTAALREWLVRASENGHRSVAIDLSSVDFMAVSGLYVLCDEQARMARHRARLTVICSAQRILHLFEVCRLDDVLRVVPARSSLDGRGWGSEDDERAERLDAWLDRYAAGSSAS